MTQGLKILTSYRQSSFKTVALIIIKENQFTGHILLILCPRLWAGRNWPPKPNLGHACSIYKSEIEKKLGEPCSLLRVGCSGNKSLDKIDGYKKDLNCHF